MVITRIGIIRAVQIGINSFIVTRDGWHDVPQKGAKERFLKRWGVEGWQLVIQEFIARAPEFKGDVELAKTIGEITADIEAILKE